MLPYFDLHCDTIYESLAQGCDISNPEFHITPGKSSYLSPYIQCFAICVPEEIRGEKATEMYIKAHERLVEQCADLDAFRPAVAQNSISEL